MTVIHHLDVGERVVIKHRAAADIHGHTAYAATGKITGTGKGLVGDVETEGFLVARDDSARGCGPGGEWFCRPDDLEPEELALGTEVVTRLRIRARVVGMAHSPDGIRYTVQYPREGQSVPVTETSVARVELEIAQNTAPAEWSPVTPAEAVAMPPQHEQPPRVAEMHNWTFDMSVPLNHGARWPTNLPNDSDERKKYPLGQVLFGQFGAAMVDLARHSWEGNNKHNPGQDLQDARDKSNDDLDCALRHLMEGDYRGAHWRVARLHQKQLEAEGAPVAPLATFG